MSVKIFVKLCFSAIAKESGLNMSKLENIMSLFLKTLPYTFSVTYHAWVYTFPSVEEFIGLNCGGSGKKRSEKAGWDVSC